MADGNRQTSPFDTRYQRNNLLNFQAVIDKGYELALSVSKLIPSDPKKVTEHSEIEFRIFEKENERIALFNVTRDTDDGVKTYDQASVLQHALLTYEKTLAVVGEHRDIECKKLIIPMVTASSKYRLGHMVLLVITLDEDQKIDEAKVYDPSPRKLGYWYSPKHIENAIGSFTKKTTKLSIEYLGQQGFFDASSLSDDILCRKNISAILNDGQPDHDEQPDHDGQPDRSARVTESDRNYEYEKDGNYYTQASRNHSLMSLYNQEAGFNPSAPTSNQPTESRSALRKKRKPSKKQKTIYSVNIGSYKNNDTLNTKDIYPTPSFWAKYASDSGYHHRKHWKNFSTLRERLSARGHKWYHKVSRWKVVKYPAIAIETGLYVLESLAYKQTIKKVCKSAMNLLKGKKVVKSILRVVIPVLFAAGLIALGTLLFPGIGTTIASAMSLSILSAAGTIPALLEIGGFLFGGLYAGVMLAKQLGRLYSYFRHGDTNHDKYRLSKKNRAALSDSQNFDDHVMQDKLLRHIRRKINSYKWKWLSIPIPYKKDKLKFYKKLHENIFQKHLVPHAAQYLNEKLNRKENKLDALKTKVAEKYSTQSHAYSTKEISNLLKGTIQIGESEQVAPSSNGRDGFSQRILGDNGATKPDRDGATKSARVLSQLSLYKKKFDSYEAIHSRSLAEKHETAPRINKYNRNKGRFVYERTAQANKEMFKKVKKDVIKDIKSHNRNNPNNKMKFDKQLFTLWRKKIARDTFRDAFFVKPISSTSHRI